MSLGNVQRQPGTVWSLLCVIGAMQPSSTIRDTFVNVRDKFVSCVPFRFFGWKPYTTEVATLTFMTRLRCVCFQFLSKNKDLPSADTSALFASRYDGETDGKGGGHHDVLWL